MIHVDDVLAKIRPTDRVLDVGGWSCPFNRADWVLDCEPYETRGYYEKVGLPKSQGGEREYFTKETWVHRDVCGRDPWPFPDKYFDFSICSHLLEDVRDPLFVCSELIRVSKRGYLETPSRLAESCRGWESDAIAGLSHHRWLIDYGANRLDFCMKFHMIHGDESLSLPPAVFRALAFEDHFSSMFWEDSFEYSEAILVGLDTERDYLRRFVERHRDRIDAAMEATRSPEVEGSASDAVHSLHEAEAFGPIALGVARRIRRASLRYPAASSTLKPLLRMGRSFLRPGAREES